MRHYFAVLLLATGLGCSEHAAAGKSNAKLRIGDAAPSWADLEGVDGKKHALADLKDKEVIVVVFTTNHCPVAVAHEDRLIAFARKHARPEDKVALVAINCNTGPADTLPRMKERAREKGFNFPYLFDPSQQVGRAYGAASTPTFFVLNQARQLVYRGAMEGQEEGNQVTHHYLDVAVQATLHGEEILTKETRSFGCAIQYD
jgi:peroxiredoxin